jgi:flagellar protein FlaI
MMQALDVFSVQAQVFIGNKRERRNFDITENLGIDPITKNIKTMKIFEWDPTDDTFSGLEAALTSKVLTEISRVKAWSKDEVRAELEVRIKLLKVMAERAATPEEFISAVRTFQVNPEKVKKVYGI